VAHLSKAQLARKRANDREAQRNIRQRTKEHIETLERKVRELEDEKRDNPSSLEKVLKRNEELECEVQKLRAQINIQLNAPLPTPPIPGADNVTLSNAAAQSHLMMPKSTVVDYFPDGEEMWNGRGPIMESIVETGNNTPYSSAAGTPLYPVPTSMGYAESENSQHIYSPLDEPIWDEPLLPPSQCSNKSSIQTWTSFPSSVDHHSSSRYHHNDVQLFPHPQFHQQQAYPTTTTACWQAQPCTFAWQITTKIKPPSSAVDHILLSCMQAQRSLQLSLPPSSHHISYPAVSLLFQVSSASATSKASPSPSHNISTSPLTHCMSLYASLLQKRGFSSSRIPEKLTSFICTYHFHTWLLTPSSHTYNALHEWQAPRPSQLLIPHPAWMDLVPWGKMRDKLIHEQDQYATEEFQRDYVEGFRVGWRGDSMACLEMVGNGLMMGSTGGGMGMGGSEMRVSRQLEEWVRDAGNFYMGRAFGEKWPEFGECCRFEDA